MKSKAKYFVWTLPSLLIAVMALMILALQSCRIPIHIQDGRKFINMEDAYMSLFVYGIILLTGTCVSIYTLAQVNKISKKLKELGHPI